MVFILCVYCASIARILSWSICGSGCDGNASLSWVWRFSVLISIRASWVYKRIMSLSFSSLTLRRSSTSFCNSANNACICRRRLTSLTASLIDVSVLWISARSSSSRVMSAFTWSCIACAACYLAAILASCAVCFCVKWVCYASNRSCRRWLSRWSVLTLWRSYYNARRRASLIRSRYMISVERAWCSRNALTSVIVTMIMITM